MLLRKACWFILHLACLCRSLPDESRAPRAGFVLPGGKVAYRGLKKLALSKFIQAVQAEIKAAPSVGRRLSELGSLSEELSKVIFPLPDIGPLEAGPVNVSITNFICRDMHIGKLLLQTARTDPLTVMMEVFVGDIRVTCTADIHGRNIFGRNSVKIDATSTMYSKATFHSTVADATPVQMLLPKCDTHLVASLSFTGGIWAFIGNVFQGLIMAIAKNAIRKLICDLFRDLTEEPISKHLSSISGALAPYLLCQPGEVPIVNGTEECRTSLPPLQPDPLALERSLMPVAALENWVDLEHPCLDSTYTGTALCLLTKELPGKLVGDKRGDLGMHVNMNELLDDGKWSIDLGTDLLDSDPRWEKSLTIKKIEVYGLNSFDRFALLEAIGKYTLSILGFHLRELDVGAEVDFILKPKGDLPNTPTGTDRGIVESFKVELGLKRFEMDLCHMLAIESGGIGQIQAGHIVEAALALLLPDATNGSIDNAKGCFFSKIYTLNLTKLFVQIDDIDQPRVTGLLHDGVDDFINGMVATAFRLYKMPALRALPVFAATTGLNKINAILHNLTHDAVCPAIELSRPSFFNFQGSAVLKGLKKKVLDLFSLPSNTIAGFNHWLGNKTNDTGVPGRFQTSINTILPLKLENGEQMNLGIHDVAVSGLDAWKNINLVDPTSPFSFNNELSIGRYKAFGKRRLTDSNMEGWKIVVNMSAYSGAQRNNFTFSLGYRWSFVLGMLMKIDTNVFDALRLDQFTDVTCLLTPFGLTGLGLTNLSFVLDGLLLDMDCYPCDHPGFSHFSQAWKTEESLNEFRRAQRGFNEMIAKIGSHLTSSTFHEDIFNRLLADAHLNCGRDQEPEDWFEFIVRDLPSEGVHEFAWRVLWFLLIVGIGLCGPLCIHYNFICCVSACPSKRLLHLLAEDECPSDEDVDTDTKAIACHDEVPPFCQIGIPFLLFLCILCFLGAHLLVTIQLDVLITFLGFDFTLEELLTIRLIQFSLSTLWGASMILALFIIGTSVVWPYARLIMLIVLWYAPTRCVSQRDRGWWFHTLDSLSKWSMFDIFSMLLLMVVLNLKVLSTDTAASLPKDLYNIAAQVSAQHGLYLNLVGQCLSQLVYNFQFCYHHRVFKHSRQLVNDYTSDVENPGGSLSMSSYARKTMKANGCGNFAINLIIVAVPVGLVLSAVCHISGLYLPAFSVTRTGFFAVIQDFGGMDRVEVYSLASMGRHFIDPDFRTSWTTHIGQWIIALIGLITIGIIPVILAIISLVLWFVPLRKPHYLLQWRDILTSWSYAEVFLVSLFVTVWQMSKAALVVAAGVGVIFSKLLGSVMPVRYLFRNIMGDTGLLTQEDANIFTMKADLQSGAYLLTIAYFLKLFIQLYVRRWVTCYHAQLVPEQFANFSDAEEEEDYEDEEDLEDVE